MSTNMGRPRALSAKYREDFAYPTVKDRLPVILTKVIDYVYRLRPTITAQHAEEGVEDLKSICAALSKLKSEMQTDKPLKPIEDASADAVLWNEYLKHTEAEEGQAPSWFKSVWLYTECYFYRKIMESIHLSVHLKDLDPFQAQKQQAYSASKVAITSLGAYLIDVCDQLKLQNKDNLNEHFQQFMQVSLWGNRCDLSISAGAENAQTTNPVNQLNKLQSNLLCNEGDQLWHHLSNNSSQPGRIDIVLDNSGFELFADLCFAEYLLAAGLATVIHLHGKTIPWFVSDVTSDDFHWTLDQLSNDESTKLQCLADQWKHRLKDGSWKFHCHQFWTLPHDFSQMKTLFPELYNDLSQAELIFFKGDLNYRKLAGDLKWPPTTSFKEALRGFHPAPLCTLRSLKCDLVVGLADGIAESTATKDKTWMTSGKWAVIQMCSTKGQ